MPPKEKKKEKKGKRKVTDTVKNTDKVSMNTATVLEQSAFYAPKIQDESIKSKPKPQPVVFQKVSLFGLEKKLEKQNKKANLSNKSYSSSPYRRLDEVQLMKSGREVILDFLNKESIDEEDIIFIKDRDST